MISLFANIVFWLQPYAVQSACLRAVFTDEGIKSELFCLLLYNIQYTVHVGDEYDELP